MLTRDPLHLSRWPEPFRTAAIIVLLVVSLVVIGVLTVGIAICWTGHLAWGLITESQRKDSFVTTAN